MNKAIVVNVQRDRAWRPKLSIVVEGRFRSVAAADTYITSKLRQQYDKARNRRHWSKWSSMRILDLRIVDEEGLKRLYAAAKASATLRRRRGAQKAAKTRAKNLAARKESARISNWLGCDPDTE